MVHLKNVARDVETGAPFTTGNATIKGPDGSTLATPAVNGSTGFWEYQANGQPGITEQSYVAAGQTKIVSGDARGQAGDWCESELSRILQLFGDGVINGLTMAAPGGMAVQVGTGNLLNLGVLHPIYSAENVTIGAAHASLTRIDRVVSRLTRTGTFAGKVVLAVVAGTASGSPVAPALTQDANTWEVEVARVTVPGAASSIVLGNISTATRPISTGPVADGSVTLAKLASGVIIPGLLPGLQASQWYSALSVASGAIITQTIAATGLVEATPFLVPKATTLTGLGMQRIGGTTVSCTGRLGVYNAGSDGKPAARLLDAGSISLNSAGVKTITGLSTPLAAGWYWLAVSYGTFSGSLTALSLDGSNVSGAARRILGASSAGDTAAYVGYSCATDAAGALPDPFGTTSRAAIQTLAFIQTSGT